MFLPGYAGPPDNKIQPSHLKRLLQSKTREEAERLYSDLGYEGDFNRDILRNKRSLQGQGQMIINTKCKFHFIKAPEILLPNGSNIFNVEDIKF